MSQLPQFSFPRQRSKFPKTLAADGAYRWELLLDASLASISLGSSCFLRGHEKDVQQYQISNVKAVPCSTKANNIVTGGWKMQESVEERKTGLDEIIWREEQERKRGTGRKEKGWAAFPSPSAVILIMTRHPVTCQASVIEAWRHTVRSPTLLPLRVLHQTRSEPPPIESTRIGECIGPLDNWTSLSPSSNAQSLRMSSM